MARPTSLIDTLERVTDNGIQDILDSADVIDRMLGERPYGQSKLPERSQVRRYSLIRDDPQAWDALIKEHGPGNAAEYAARLEKLSQKYPDELIMPPQPKFPELEHALQTTEPPNGIPN